MAFWELGEAYGVLASAHYLAFLAPTAAGGARGPAYAAASLRSTDSIPVAIPEALCFRLNSIAAETTGTRFLPMSFLQPPSRLPCCNSTKSANTTSPHIRASPPMKESPHLPPPHAMHNRDPYPKQRIMHVRRRDYP